MNDPITAIIAELESSHETDNIGMFTIRTANRTIAEAAMRPNPRQLYQELWYEGEVCCLFSDSNLGKSIYAVQMADTIATLRPVLLVDCELTDKQFQMRYTDIDTGVMHIFPELLYRAEINPNTLDVKDYETKIFHHIEAAAQHMKCNIIIIDNLTYLCNSSDKGVDAGLFMMKLMNLKKKYGWSLLIIAHTPKRSLMSPITQNDLAGSKKLYNFFDSVFAIGKSAKDSRLRYVKQLKVRAGEFRYDSSNVIVYEIEKTDGFVHFEFKEFSTEKEHLKERTEKEITSTHRNVHELKSQGKSTREIAAYLGLSKSKVDRLIHTPLPSVPTCPTVPADGTPGTNGTPGTEQK
ncbi:MAG: AAA family ATPase [Bacteroidaceae bacterium]|nr:AAA family ATPase [Bacteroidaceae bacterium]